MSLSADRRRLLAVIDERIAALHPQPDRGIQLEKSDPQVWACEQRPRGCCYNDKATFDSRTRQIGTLAEETLQSLTSAGLQW